MAEVVKFTATRLGSSGKKGVITPDAEGYYEVVIGGLNTFNSVGEYYTLEGAKSLFERSSIFMRRVLSGCLKGETGHPKRAPGMSKDDYVKRILSIEETNICCHFRDIWLDPNYGRNNPHLKMPELVAIVAKLKPAGPNGPALEKALQSPGENVCFSIRAMTKDYFNRGTCYRVLAQILTWDWVTEPGIACSTKFNSPALESFSLESLSEERVTRATIERIATQVEEGVAIEASNVMAKQCLASLDVSLKSQPPSFLAKW